MLSLAILLPTKALAQSLSITGTCPGTLAIEVTDALPGTEVAFVAGDAGPGDAVFSGGPCTGLPSGVAGPLRLLGTFRTPDGTLSLAPTVGDGACGAAVVALDLETCGVSSRGVIGGVDGFFAVDARARSFPGPYNLYRVDLDTDAVETVAELAFGITRITFLPDGTLVGTTAEDPPRLVTIDIATGDLTPLLTTTFPFGHNSGLAWVDDDLWGWSEGGDDLIRFDLDAETDTTWDIGLGTSSNCMFTDGDGQLYDLVSADLHTVDPRALTTTYVATVSGFIEGGTKSHGCTMHEGVLYVNADGSPQLYEVDLTTWIATPTGISLPENVNGIASATP